MKTITAVLLVIFTAAVAGAITSQVTTRSRNAEIARIASVNVESAVRVRKAFDSKFEGEAKNLLDVSISQHLFYMQSFESGALPDASYARQRGRSVASVKREWLERPPFAVEDETRAYIEEVCRQTTECPPGEIQAKK
jgi:hypothetical protein